MFRHFSICRSVAALLVPLFAAFTAQAGPIVPAALNLDLEQAVIAPSEQPVDVHVLIRIEGSPAPVIDQDAERLPLNLGLVLDTSGSMSDARKWDYALEAAYGVIDRLDEGDRLSISTYSNAAKVLAAQDDLSRPDALRAALAALYPDGGTNISAGLMNNARLLSFGKAGERLTRIVLMSDGLANDGIQNVDGMRDLVERIADAGTTVSSIGLGADYDETMLRAIAAAGNGNYYYVESPSQVTAIFRSGSAGPVPDRCGRPEAESGGRTGCEGGAAQRHCLSRTSALTWARCGTTKASCWWRHSAWPRRRSAMRSTWVRCSCRSRIGKRAG